MKAALLAGRERRGVGRGESFLSWKLEVDDEGKKDSSKARRCESERQADSSWTRFPPNDQHSTTFLPLLFSDNTMASWIWAASPFDLLVGKFDLQLSLVGEASPPPSLLR